MTSRSCQLLKRLRRGDGRANLHGSTNSDSFSSHKMFQDFIAHPGISCETDVDECMSLPCQHNTTCVDRVNSFTCHCVNGFTGTTCETNLDECQSNPCLNLATCQDGVNGYECACVPGYDGIHCDNDIDECASLPCQHGGSCDDFLDGFVCTCPVGFTGEICQININECESGKTFLNIHILKSLESHFLWRKT